MRDNERWGRATPVADLLKCESALSLLVKPMFVPGKRAPPLFTGAPFVLNGAFVKRCVTCPSGSLANAATNVCQACPYPQTLQSGNCLCPSSLPTGSRCTDLDALTYATQQLSVASTGALQVCIRHHGITPGPTPCWEPAHLKRKLHTRCCYITMSVHPPEAS